jgi:hypothetical protein
MRNTLRATTGLVDGDTSSRTKEALLDPATHRFPCAEPTHNKAGSPPRQVRITLRRKSCDHRVTFAAILQSEQGANIVRLKNRVFVSNKIAKLLTGRSQALCYQVKNAAVSALVEHGAASLLSLEPSNRGPVLGLAFVGGGRLHVRPMCLDTQTQITIQAKFATAVQSGSYFSGDRR